MKKVLVAGATGYLGRYVVKKLKKRGYRVRALVRNADKMRIPGPYFAPAIDKLADEVVVCDATRPETLVGVCEGIDVVFSSLGMIKPDFVHTIFEVDYQANMNILAEALKSKVSKFIYVSVFDAHRMMNIPNIQAHEKFVRELKASPIESTIIRPTGYYSEIGQFVARARRGFMLMVGDGFQRSNPIHGSDLAAVCTDAIDSNEKEIEAGGPEVFTYMEMVDLAAEIAKNDPFVLALPLPVADAMVAITGIFNRDVHDVALFATTVSRIDTVAPLHGTHRLRDFFTKCRDML